MSDWSPSASVAIFCYSDDAGKHWQQAAVPVSADLTAVNFPTATQGWAVGNDGVVLHSSDAGATWNKQLDGRQIGALLVKHYTALASAEPGNEQWPQLVAEGQRLVEEGADKPLLDVWFANDKVGYVVGVFNLILRTEDGGQHWTPFQDRTDNPQGLHLNAIASTGDALYIAGEQGLLLKWDDSASSASSPCRRPIRAAFSACIGKPGEVLVYGLRGNVFRSTDGGAELDRARHRPARQHHRRPRSMPDGHYRLFTQAGQMLVSQGDGAQLAAACRNRHRPRSPAPPSPPTARWCWSGSRGVRALRRRIRTRTTKSENPDMGNIKQDTMPVIRDLRDFDRRSGNRLERLGVQLPSAVHAAHGPGHRGAGLSWRRPAWSCAPASKK